MKNSKGGSEFFKDLPLSAVYIKKIQGQKKNQDLVFTLDNSNLTTVVVTHYEDKDQFNGLVWARTLLSKYHTQLTPEVCILFDESINQDVVSRSLWMAASAQSFELENFKSKKSSKDTSILSRESLFFVVLLSLFFQINYHLLCLFQIIFLILLLLEIH